MRPAAAIVMLITLAAFQDSGGEERARAADLGLTTGILEPGPLNAITDVAGVRVGHATVIEGEDVRTGVTAILPHGRNLFAEKVPAAIHSYNAFGKLAGSTQVEELGNIEAPIFLTNTLSVGDVLAAGVRHMLDMPGNENVRSVNVVVGETNDGYLNDIRGQHVRAAHVEAALADAKTGPVTEGSVGAGAGTAAFGYKGGIGTASRRVPVDGGKVYTVGVLVQSNFGWILNINGIPFTRTVKSGAGDPLPDEDGSGMIVIATDAPLDARNLKRLARRSFAGMARTRSVMTNGSGDYAIAFSTAWTIPAIPENGHVDPPPLVTNGTMNNIFLAVEEATQEAIYNSIFMATDMTGRDGHELKAIPLDRVRALAKHYNLENLRERLDWRPVQ